MAPAQQCDCDSFDLWLGTTRGSSQLGASADFAEAGCTDLARDAAYEGIVSLRLALAAYSKTDEFRRYAEWVRNYAEKISEEVREQEPETLQDAALRNSLSGYASAVRECDVLPAIVQEDLAEHLASLSSEGAAAVAAAMGSCALAERALKSKRS